MLIQRKEKFGIRKLTLGVGSVLLGTGVYVSAEAETDSDPRNVGHMVKEFNFDSSRNRVTLKLKDGELPKGAYIDIYTSLPVNWRVINDRLELNNVLVGNVIHMQNDAWSKGLKIDKSDVNTVLDTATNPVSIREFLPLIDNYNLNKISDQFNSVYRVCLSTNINNFNDRVIEFQFDKLSYDYQFGLPVGAKSSHVLDRQYKVNHAGTIGIKNSNISLEKTFAYLYTVYYLYEYKYANNLYINGYGGNISSQSNPIYGILGVRERVDTDFRVSAINLIAEDIYNETVLHAGTRIKNTYSESQSLKKIDLNRVSVGDIIVAQKRDSTQSSYNSSNINNAKDFYFYDEIPFKVDDGSVKVRVVSVDEYSIEYELVEDVPVKTNGGFYINTSQFYDE